MQRKDKIEVERVSSVVDVVITGEESWIYINIF